MSLDLFIPEIWSAQLLHNLNNAHVYAQPSVTNRDYEGEISGAGATVHINSIGRVTVGDYTKGGDIGVPEQLTDATRLLHIDQAKFVNFAIDDIDKAQQSPKVMGEALLETAYALSQVADLYIANLGVAAAASNIGSNATPIDLTGTKASNAYLVLLQLKTALDKKNASPADRVVIVPPDFEAALLQDDRFVRGFQTGETVLRNGYIGRVAGFDVLVSNNVPCTTTGAGATLVQTAWKVQASAKGARTYAEQISDLHAYRPEHSFSDAMKALHVYGAKIVRPECLAVATVNL